MSNKGIVKKIVYSVILNNGQVIDHVFDMPKTSEEFKKHLDQYVDRVFNALALEQKSHFSFEHPFIVYNSNSVAAVKIEGITAGDLEEATKRASKKAGFVK